jgi:hypothetical protein
VVAVKLKVAVVAVTVAQSAALIDAAAINRLSV